MKNQLILVGAIFVAAVAFYFIASPYENCKREYSLPDIAGESCIDMIYAYKHR